MPTPEFVPTLQSDLLEIYNSLVLFSKDTLESSFPKPIKVWYEEDSRLLVFEQGGRSVRLVYPVYYCLDLESLKKPTYLLPRDYDFLMMNLENLINSGELIRPRVHVSPENCGFDVYSVDYNELHKGPQIKGRIRFVSGNSWIFRFLTKRKYKL